MKYIIYDKGVVFLEKSGKVFNLPESVYLDESENNHTFIDEDYMAVHACSVGSLDRFEQVTVRESWKHLAESDYRHVVKSVELLEWDDAVRYCSVCGNPLRRASEISKKCDNCGKEYFPQLSPAVIVLVTKGEQALLVRAKNFSRPFYALVAGFVETGESLEECVAREIKEETDLEVKNIRYFGSQSWPFPGQLMIGFTAEWKSGEIMFNDGELISGGFFDRDNVPQLPTMPSISRILINYWLEKG